MKNNIKNIKIKTYINNIIYTFTGYFTLVQVLIYAIIQSANHMAATHWIYVVRLNSAAENF